MPTWCSTPARRRGRAAASRPPRARLPRCSCASEAGDHAVGGANVLDLQHRPLAGLVRPSSGLATMPSRPAPSKRSQPLLGDRAVARRRRQVERRARIGEQPLEGAAALIWARSSRLAPASASRSKATNDAGVARASLATRDAAGCRRCCSASKSRPSARRRRSRRRHAAGGSARRAPRAARGNSGRAGAGRGSGSPRRRRRSGRRARESRPTSARTGNRRRPEWPSTDLGEHRLDRARRCERHGRRSQSMSAPSRRRPLSSRAANTSSRS